MPHAVKSCLKVNQVVLELLLVLHVFLNDDSAVEDLFHCAPLSSESRLLFGKKCLGHTFQSTEDDA
ncbi:hypothetical protein DPMN_170516 [Dreissena polymorpha]|uniref:Secreted protein n=1 Tax=Dreissena polymorpha TaxID=45954 RepID=A0A9D4IBL5_DREPO|nr:hypothetical protein DPMN_170516 [Dreissena polymorpha]